MRGQDERSAGKAADNLSKDDFKDFIPLFTFQFHKLYGQVAGALQLRIPLAPPTPRTPPSLSTICTPRRYFTAPHPRLPPPRYITRCTCCLPVPVFYTLVAVLVVMDTLSIIFPLVGVPIVRPGSAQEGNFASTTHSFGYIVVTLATAIWHVQLSQRIGSLAPPVVLSKRWNRLLCRSCLFRAGNAATGAGRGGKGGGGTGRPGDQTGRKARKRSGSLSPSGMSRRITDSSRVLSVTSSLASTQTTPAPRLGELGRTFSNGAGGAASPGGSEGPALCDVFISHCPADHSAAAKIMEQLRDYSTLGEAPRCMCSVSRRNNANTHCCTCFFPLAVVACARPACLRHLVLSSGAAFAERGDLDGGEEIEGGDVAVTDHRTPTLAGRAAGYDRRGQEVQPNGDRVGLRA